MPSAILLLDGLLALVGLIILKHMFVGRRRAQPLPPGPKALPLLGNMLDMPTEKEWLTFAQWGDRWGQQPTPVFCVVD